MIRLKAKENRYSSRGSGKILNILTKILLCKAKRYAGKLGVSHAFLAPNKILSFLLSFLPNASEDFSRAAAVVFLTVEKLDCRRDEVICVFNTGSALAAIYGAAKSLILFLFLFMFIR